jgi:hypothetical protein
VPPLAVHIGGSLALGLEGHPVLRLRLLPDVLDEGVVQVRRLQAGEAGLEEGVGGVAVLE